MDKIEQALGVVEQAAGALEYAGANKRGVDSVRQALTTLRAELEGKGWQPIESAPRDGSCVLLADGGCVTPGFYHDGSECYGHRGGAGFFDEADRGSLLTASNFDATHWMPLPSPPALDRAREVGSDG